jgi:hypothetical protein
MEVLIKVCYSRKRLSLKRDNSSLIASKGAKEEL